MANAIYPAALEAALGGGMGLVAGNVKALLVNLSTGTTYTYSSAHDFLDDVPAGARIASTANLGSKTATGGVFDSANPTFSAVPTGDAAEALILYVDSGDAATSRLIAYYDTGVTGLPVTPNGGDINVTVGTAWFSLAG